MLKGIDPLLGPDLLQVLAPLGYFEIVTNIILGYYFFGDFPHYWTWVGLAIIICSGIYISLRERLSVVIR